MNKKITIVPAIIPTDFNYLKKELQYLKNKVNRVQIDVTDGNYTPNVTWPYHSKFDSIFESISGQKEGMPYWESFNFDLDLMVVNPEEKYQKWVTAGASSLIFHLESLSGDKVAFIQKVKEENMIDIGIAIQTKTPNDELEPFLDIVDFVQFMGIEKIGYQGQEFDEKVLEKIKALRVLKPDMDIMVDGSVNFETVEELAEAGANIFVSGSALLKAEDITDAIQEMNDMVESVNVGRCQE